MSIKLRPEAPRTAWSSTATFNEYKGADELLNLPPRPDPAHFIEDKHIFTPAQDFPPPKYEDLERQRQLHSADGARMVRLQRIGAITLSILLVIIIAVGLVFIIRRSGPIR